VEITIMHTLYFPRDLGIIAVSTPPKKREKKEKERRKKKGREK